MALVFDEYRLTTDALRYGFAVGKVRVLEARMLDRVAYERVVDAPTFEEQMRLLSDTSVGRYLEHARSADDVERCLDEALDAFYRFLDEAALPSSVTRFFRARYDYSNLKAALKAQLLGVSISGLIVRHGSVSSESYSGDLTRLPAPLGPLAATVMGSDEPQVDDMVDAAMFADLKRLAKEAKSPYLARVATLMIDIGNAKSMLRGALSGAGRARVEAMILDGGSILRAQLVQSAGLGPEEMAAALQKLGPFKRLLTTDLLDPAKLDVAMDGLLVSMLREGRRGPTGPEPVIAYVFAREAEVSTVRMLLLGKLSGVPSETLRTRLRATYG